MDVLRLLMTTTDSPYSSGCSDACLILEREFEKVGQKVQAAVMRHLDA